MLEMREDSNMMSPFGKQVDKHAGLRIRVLVWYCEQWNA